MPDRARTKKELLLIFCGGGRGRERVTGEALHRDSEDASVAQLCLVLRTDVIHVTANRNPSTPIRHNRARYQPASFTGADVP